MFLFLTHITSTFAFSFLIANISNKAVKQLFILLMLVSLYMKILWAHWYSFFLFFLQEHTNRHQTQHLSEAGASVWKISLSNHGEGVSVKMGKILTKLFFVGSVSWQHRIKFKKILMKEIKSRHSRNRAS